MTASWANLVRGPVFDSLEANSGGILLAVAARFRLSGTDGLATDWFVILSALAFTAVSLIDWGVQMSAW